jgi:hypothetical protein
MLENLFRRCGERIGPLGSQVSKPSCSILAIGSMQEKKKLGIAQG